METLAKKNIHIKFLKKTNDLGGANKGAFSKKMSAAPILGSATGGYLGGKGRLDVNHLKRE